MNAFDPLERKRLYDRIQTHPGRAARDRWQSLIRIHGVLRANERELLMLIDHIQADSGLAMQVVGNMGPTGTRESFYNELIRRAHNYLSAVMTLVDHSRNLMGDYEAAPVKVEYDRRVEAMVSTARGPVLQKLRNYLLHWRIPPFGVQVNVGDGDDPDTVLVFLDREAALEFGEWSTAARRWLRDQPDKISLRDLIVGYATDVEELYGWLFGQFEQLHGEEMRELGELIVQLQGARNTPGHPDFQPPNLREHGAAPATAGHPDSDTEV